MNTLKTSQFYLSKLNILMIGILFQSILTINLNRNSISFTQLHQVYTNKTNYVIANYTNYGANPIYKAYGVCNSDTCVNGVCFNNSTCICKPGYAQLPDSGANLCDYKLYSQLTAFFLELFLIFGFGHLYIGRILNFVLKLVIILTIISLDFLFKYFIKSDGYHSKKAIYISSYIFYAAIVAWQVLDVVLFGLNYFKDENDMPLWVYQG